MKAKRRTWNHETAAARLIAERGGAACAADLYNRISLVLGVRVARTAHEAHSAGIEASPASVAACLLGVLLEAKPCPGQRWTDAPVSRIGAHFGLGERTTRIALEVLESAGVIAIQRTRGRRLRIVLCDGIDPPLSESGLATPEPAKPWKVRRRATALCDTESELCDTKCGGTPPHSKESAVAGHRTVRWYATALDEHRKRLEVATEECVAEDSRSHLAASLDIRSEEDQTRARPRDPTDTVTTHAAPSADPIGPSNEVEKHATHELADIVEPEPELRRGRDGERSTNLADESKGVRSLSGADPSSDDDRIILRVREQELLKGLGIADYVIQGASAAGITSAEVLPVIAASEVRRERWLRAAEIGRWIRTTARERGRPITDPAPAPTPMNAKTPPKTRAHA